MKKSLIIPIVAGVLLACGTAQAESKKCGEGLGRISVTGQGEVKALPDIVLLNYRVSALKPTPDEARKEVEKTVTAFSKSVQDLKLGDKAFVADDISIMPRYEYKDSKQILLGYEAGRNVRITLSDFALISKVTDKAMASGINQIAGFVYQISNQEKYKQEAAKKAMVSVQEQAKMLADGFNVKLEFPCNISYSSYGGVVPVYRNAMVMSAAKAADSAPQVEATYSPDEIEIKATISAEYAISPNKKD